MTIRLHNTDTDEQADLPCSATDLHTLATAMLEWLLTAEMPAEEKVAVHRVLLRWRDSLQE